MKRRVKVFFDGGCRPNPGAMEAAVVIKGRAYFFDGLGAGSNTQAEWRALLCAITLAHDLGLQHADILGDSLEVTRKAYLAATSGRATSSEEAELLAVLQKYRPARIRWIRRAQNLAGIALDGRRLR